MHYEALAQGAWKGRVDGDTAAYFRWHQVIACLNLDNPAPVAPGSTVFFGFCSDEGVRRNKGRIGAARGPAAIRSVLANLPVHHLPHRIYDAGNIHCIDGHLEQAQEALAKAVETIIKMGGRPILLGGGHEITYGHVRGIQRTLEKNKILGLINIDAHFDIREPEQEQATSGTGFFQLLAEAEQTKTPLKVLAVGIQSISNTLQLFQTAAAWGVSYIQAEELANPENRHLLMQRMDAFVNSVDYLYVTVDLDAFMWCQAPGVSATAFSGIAADYLFYNLFKRIIAHPKLIAYDIAELNPRYDIDNRTAKLAADLIFKSVTERK